MCRVVGALVLVFLFLTLVFYVVEVAPGDPSRTFLPRGCSVSGLASCPFGSQLNRLWGLDKPLFERYVIFLGNVLTGNFGVSTSFQVGRPVWDLIASALPPTLAFVGVTMLILGLLSLLLGMRMSRHRGGLLDTITSFLLSLPFAMPTMMLGLLASYLFAFVYPVFPLSLRLTTDPLQNFANQVWYSVLPELVLLGTTLGLFAWVVRDHPLRPQEDLKAPPPGEWRRPKIAATARAIGAIPRFLAAVPIFFPWTLAGVMAGEAGFNLNGAGLLLWNAIFTQNFQVLTGLVIVVGLLILLPVLLAADILHYWMTARWDRFDSATVDGFRIYAGDPLRVLSRILTSFFGLVGLALILGIVIVSAAAPLLVGPYPGPFTTARPFMPPSPQFPLGTDGFGRDVYTLLVYGGQPIVGLAILSFAFALIAGLGVVGGIGFFGERFAAFLVLPVDLFLILSLPFAMLLISTAGRDTVTWGPALVGWPVAARILLLETTGMVPGPSGRPRPMLSVRERGSRSLNLVWGTGPLILAEAFLAVSLSILAWATLAVFGLGAFGPGTVESWGEMVRDATLQVAVLRGLWWYFVPPMLCILLAVLGPTLLSLQLKQIAREAPKNALPVQTPPPIVSVAPPGQSE